MTESFEGAMEDADAIVDDYDKPIMDRVQKAHEHEIAELQATHERKAIDLQKAHDHEMEQLRRSRFREGYEAGQRSMDAAHYLLKLRLQGLSFGDSSHENLNRLAYAIYPCPTGWGKESCEGLRDKLIELLGGVHDEPEPIPASGGACDADCDCGCEQPQTVAYDELDNERQKAVCELRKLDSEHFKSKQFMGDLMSALDYDWIEKVSDYREETVNEFLCDRLIHLLGGDECNFSVGKSYMDDMGEKSNPAETSDASTGHVILDTPLPNFSEPNLPKSVEIAKPEREDGGENCRITDELREWMDLVLTADDQAWDIADRIDEQFNHAMISRSAELGCYKLHINQLEQERDELRKSLREIAERVGVPHDVDLDEYSDDLVAKATLGKIDSTHEYIGALEWQRDRQRKLLDEYENADTPEEIVRDIHLGIATDTQAVERIRALR